MIAGEIRMAIAKPAREIAEVRIEPIVEDNDHRPIPFGDGGVGLNAGRIPARHDKRLHEVVKLRRDLPERETAVVEHVRPFRLFLRIAGVNVEERQFLLGRDLPDQIVHPLGVGRVCIEIGVERDRRHRNKRGGGMIVAQAGNQFAKVLGVVVVEVIALCHIVRTVADEDIIHAGQFRRDLVVAPRVDQPPDEFPAQAEVDHLARRQVAFGGEQLLDHVFQVRPLRRDLARNAALGRAVTEQDDLQFSFMGGPGCRGSRNEPDKVAEQKGDGGAGFHEGHDGNWLA